MNTYTNETANLGLKKNMRIRLFKYPFINLLYEQTEQCVQYDRW